MSEIKKCVNKAQEKACMHSLHCENLITNFGLSKALEYAKTQGIKPPECSLTAQSTNADIQRSKAARMLSESKWWARRLKKQAEQSYVEARRELGEVDNFIPDEMYIYQKAKGRN